MARISQDDTGVLLSIGDTITGDEAGHVAVAEDSEAEPETSGARTVYLPTAMLACLFLGPGATITHRAVATLARHGTTLVCVGSQGVRCYASANAPASTTLLSLAAKVSTDPDLRLTAARRMYGLRFGAEPPSDVTMEQLRGMEGARVRATYQALATQHGVRFKRRYQRDDFETADPVNKALSSANSCLYGIVAATLSSLGIPHGLGIVHSGHAQSLVYDIADLYKAEVTIPAAFSVHKLPDPERAVRVAFRERLTLMRLLPRIVSDVRYVLGDSDKRPTPEQAGPAELVSLWDSAGDIAGGRNHGDPHGTETW